MSISIPVAKLLAVCDPFTNPWGSGTPFHVEDVQQAIAEGRLQAASYPADLPTNHGVWMRRDHIERIAYLVVHGWHGPIQIDVGVPELGYEPEWMLTDGNHRLAAARVLGYFDIQAEVSGDVDYAQEIFGVDVTEPDPTPPSLSRPVFV